MKKIVATIFGLCLYFSSTLGHAALMTYVATKADRIGDNGLLGSFVYDDVLQEVTSYKLWFYFQMPFPDAGTVQDFQITDDYWLVYGSNPYGTFIWNDDGLGEAESTFYPGGWRYEGPVEILGYGSTYFIGNFTTAVPLPAAVWLFGSALLGLGLFKRKKA